ncbi:MAG: hypothetical protein E7345_04685 [Clostridiales bacterium]|nr:hypothetical protein [Clostridiales bacterium]
MEKTTKKSKKKSKRLKKRIGIIAVGGLSFVLTICLSVGATLAWFAGSSWASNDLYMGGPVYVEMAGRGGAGSTAGDGNVNSTTGEAEWIGGAGNLDIKAAASRTTGSVPIKTDANGKYVKDDTGTGIPDNVLLPGQKVQIYSQARVFSTAITDSRADGAYPNTSSGANTTNTSKAATGTVKYLDGNGRVTSTTTSVLRARFSISIEFDPSVGFNNFTDEDYMRGYPKQSTDYTALKTVDETVTHTADTYILETDGTLKTAGDKTWEGSLGHKWSSSNTTGTPSISGRRDGVDNTAGTWTNTLTPPASADDQKDATKNDLLAVWEGDKKSIYKWRYCSAKEWADATADVALTTPTYKYGKPMGYPFNGGKTVGNVGFYGVWITDTAGNHAESDAYFKARTNAYLQSYIEFYENEYGNQVTRTIQSSLETLDQSLNNDFKRLINDSSDDIMAGKVYGFNVSSTGVKQALNSDGAVATASDPKLTPINASWLYIDPSIGNDTNTNEISTSTGGWWYLVSSTGSMASGNAVDLVTDSVTDPKTNTDGVNNTAAVPACGATALRPTDEDDTGFEIDNTNRLYAKLYEIDPTITLNEVVGKNGTNDVKKVVSVAFPFVNGTFALPGDALTNIFANAKISFQISFQAIQAFFPYTTSIDDVDYKNPLFGTAKALNIQNAIPIFNEAFDYQEKFTNDSADIPL